MKKAITIALLGPKGEVLTEHNLSFAHHNVISVQLPAGVVVSGYECFVHSELQAAPVHNDLPAIQDLVIEDIQERKRVGVERYGTPLQAHNGRDALLDAYEEALDLCQYLKQALVERDGDPAADSAEDDVSS